MPPSITPSHAPSITQPITDGTFILDLVQPINLSKQHAETLQPSPGSSSFLPSPLQHPTECLQTVHKTIQQFHQHLKAEQLDRRTSQIIVLNFRMTLHYCATCFFLQLEELPTAILLLQTPLLVHHLTFTLTLSLLQMHS